MAEENKTTTAPSAADTKAANKSLLERMEQGQAEKTARQQAQSTDSKLTVSAHLGKRPDEPHKSDEMEAVKVGKAVPSKAMEKGLVEIDPGAKGEATDVVNPAGFLPSSGMHNVGGVPALGHDMEDTIRATAIANEVEPGGDKTPAGKKPDEIAPDPALEEGRQRHAGEGANIPAVVNSPVAGAEKGAGEGADKSKS